MNTGLCVLCARGEGSCAAPPANTEVGAGLNGGFIADSIPRAMSEIKQRRFWKRNSVYFVGAGLVAGTIGKHRSKAPLPSPLPALRRGERESTTVVVARCARLGSASQSTCITGNQGITYPGFRCC